MTARHGWPRSALPIGIEVGFSSAGAGALGALCLMNMTTMAPAAVVGTDLSFGLVLSTVGGGIHAAMGDLNIPVLVKLLIGGAAGALAGGLLASRLPSKKLRLGPVRGAGVAGRESVLEGPIGLLEDARSRTPGPGNHGQEVTPGSHEVTSSITGASLRRPRRT